MRGCDGIATGSATASLQFDGLHSTRQTGTLATTERVVALLDTVLNSDPRTDPEVDQCYRQPVKLNLTPTQAYEPDGLHAKSSNSMVCSPNRRIRRSPLQIFDSDVLHSKSLNPTGALAIAAAVSEETAMLVRQHTIPFSFEA